MSAPQGRMQEHDSRSANAGSRTMTVSPAPEAQAGPSTQPHAVGTLRLRGAPLRRPKVTWTDETVDNEGMGKKKSKICCIYHKPKAYDESSSESVSETDDDPPKKQYPKAKGHALRERNSQEVAEVSSESDGGAGNGKARPTRKPHRHGHNCDHGPRDPPKANKYDQKASSKDT